jgi:hypothetical protein
MALDEHGNRVFMPAATKPLNWRKIGRHGNLKWEQP